VSAPAEAFWSAVPFGPGVRRVALDVNGLAAFDKPEGVLSHPNGPRDESRSLVVARYDEDQECFAWDGGGGQQRRLWLINRLDSATSGVILAAADGALAVEIRAQFRRRRILKVYQALVFGKPRQASESWRDVLGVRKQGGQIRTAPGAGNLPAECRMTLVKSAPGAVRTSLVRLEPSTGRSHQLRVQCAKRGLPIVGDRTYGDFGANRAFVKGGGAKRMFLHCLEVGFEYDFAGRKNAFSATAPLPAEFEGIG
jgi:23S rRNA-/tRNA-specific pseudouridylate synthase